MAILFPFKNVHAYISRSSKTRDVISRKNLRRQYSKLLEIKTYLTRTPRASFPEHVGLSRSVACVTGICDVNSCRGGGPVPRSVAYNVGGALPPPSPLGIGAHNRRIRWQKAHNRGSLQRGEGGLTIIGYRPGYSKHPNGAPKQPRKVVHVQRR